MASIFMYENDFNKKIEESIDTIEPRIEPRIEAWLVLHEDPTIRELVDFIITEVSRAYLDGLDIMNLHISDFERPEVAEKFEKIGRWVLEHSKYFEEVPLTD